MARVDFPFGIANNSLSFLLNLYQIVGHQAHLLSPNLAGDTATLTRRRCSVFMILDDDVVLLMLLVLVAGTFVLRV